MEYTDKRRVTVRGIIYKDGKLFCQKLKHGTETNPFWCAPGGGVDQLESLEDAMRRELIEETGVAPRVGKLLFIQSFSEKKPGPHGEREQLEFFFQIDNPDDYTIIDERASHFALEIADYGFVDPRTENILPKFLRQLDIQDYITNNRPTYIYNEFA